MVTEKIDIYQPMLDFILTPQEYAGIPEKTPYIFQEGNSRRGILYYGSQHSKSPAHQQFGEIESLFGQFLKKYRTENVVLVIENTIPPFENSKESMIEKYGESGLLAYLGTVHEIVRECPEPKTRELNQFAFTKGFTKEDIALWIFLNALYVNTRIQPIHDTALRQIVYVLTRADAEPGF